MKEKRKQRVVEVDPSVRSLEEFVSLLFEKETRHINEYVDLSKLSSHWVDLRLGDWRLKLFPSGHRVGLWNGLESEILWDNHRKEWKLVGLTKSWGDEKIEIMRTDDGISIKIQPKDDDRFWMGDVVNCFESGIVKLDEVQRPLGKRKVESYLLGGSVQIEIDEDSLAFFSVYVGEEDEPYCLYLKKNDPLAQGLCEPMTQLLGEYFSA